MRPEYEERWKHEIEKRNGRLRKPAELLWRKVSAEDYIDSAVIGGVELAAIVAGRIAEHQIPPQVIEAFHDQYPQYGSSFVEAVQGLSDDPDRLVGLVSGIKGKLFEIEYVDWLNDHHLPEGYTAHVAESANNPAWDIEVQDAHGHAVDHLQAKASEHLGHVYEALAAHPNIDVVIPQDVYEHLSGHEVIFDHLVNGHVPVAELDGAMDHAVDAAHNAGVADHFPIAGPIIVIAFAACQHLSKYRSKQMSLSEYIQKVTERGILSVIASGAGWAVGAISGVHILALPVSVGVRLGTGQAIHNYHRREKLDGMVITIDESRKALLMKTQKLLSSPDYPEGLEVY